MDEFVKTLFKERDKLNKVCDSILLINPEEIEPEDLYFYYVEHKKRQRLGSQES